MNENFCLSWEIVIIIYRLKRVGGGGGGKGDFGGSHGFQRKRRWVRRSPTEYKGGL